MRHTKAFFVGAVILSGCSPLDEYLGFTPTEGTSHQQNNDTSSQSSSSDSNSAIAPSKAPKTPITQAQTLPEEESAEEPKSETSPPNDYVKAGDTNVPEKKYTGGSPNMTSKEIPSLAGIFQVD